MASLSLDTPTEEQVPQPVTRDQRSLLVASFGGAVAVDYAARNADCRLPIVDLTRPGALMELGSECDFVSVSACVVFLNQCLTEYDRGALDALIGLLPHVRFISIVSTFRVHLGDRIAARSRPRS